MQVNMDSVAERAAVANLDEQSAQLFKHMRTQVTQMHAKALGVGSRSG